VFVTNAKALGKNEDAKLFCRQGKKIIKMFWDKSTGWMRPMGTDGSLERTFSILFESPCFVEVLAAQSTWFVPHDMPKSF